MRQHAVSESRKLQRCLIAVLFGLSMIAGPATAAYVDMLDPKTAGVGGFKDGWATQITYDAGAARGTSNDRANPLNALGPADDKFFELGTGSEAYFTFGTSFDTDVSVYEVTFGSPSNFPEFANLYVGTGFAAVDFEFVGRISNVDAQNGVLLSLAAVSGIFDTVWLVDDSISPGAFDVDAVRVTPVPLPAAAWMFLSALGALVGLKRLNGRESTSI